MPQADTAERGSPSKLLLCCSTTGVRAAWDQGGTPPQPCSPSPPGQKRTLQAQYLL